MKRGIVLAVIFMAVGSTASWAQTNAFRIGIKGTITQADGTKVQVKDIAKGVSGLVSDTNNVLVLVYSQDNNGIEIDEVNTNSNTIVNTIACAVSKAWNARNVTLSAICASAVVVSRARLRKNTGTDWARPGPVSSVRPGPSAVF